MDEGRGRVGLHGCVGGLIACAHDASHFSIVRVGLGDDIIERR